MYLLLFWIFEIGTRSKERKTYSVPETGPYFMKSGNIYPLGSDNKNTSKGIFPSGISMKMKKEALWCTYFSFIFSFNADHRMIDDCLLPRIIWM